MYLEKTTSTMNMLLLRQNNDLRNRNSRGMLQRVTVLGSAPYNWTRGVEKLLMAISMYLQLKQIRPHSQCFNMSEFCYGAFVLRS